MLLDIPALLPPQPDPQSPPFWAQPWAPAQLFVLESEGREGNLLECRGPREVLTPKGVGPCPSCLLIDTFQDLCPLGFDTTGHPSPQPAHRARG